MATASTPRSSPPGDPDAGGSFATSGVESVLNAIPIVEMPRGQLSWSASNIMADGTDILATQLADLPNTSAMLKGGTSAGGTATPLSA
jgi:hypothetical protein